MTTTVKPVATTTAPTDLARTATLALLVSWALDAFGIWGYGHPESNAVWQMLITGLLSLVSVGLVFGLVLPRAFRRGTTGRTGIILSTLGLVIGLALFWAGIAPALAMGGIVAGRADSPRPRLSTAAYVVGILAMIGILGAFALDWMSHH